LSRLASRLAFLQLVVGIQALDIARMMGIQVKARHSKVCSSVRMVSRLTLLDMRQANGCIVRRDFQAALHSLQGMSSACQIAFRTACTSS